MNFDDTHEMFMGSFWEPISQGNACDYENKNIESSLVSITGIALNIHQRLLVSEVEMSRQCVCGLFFIEQLFLVVLFFCKNIPKIDFNKKHMPREDDKYFGLRRRNTANYLA